MKKFAIISVITALLVVVILLLRTRALTGTQRRNDYTITMQLTGTAGASFSGEYVRDGKRVTFSGVLPWSGSELNVTRLEIRKENPEDTLTVDARGGNSRITAQSVAGTRGVKVEMEEGWSVETIR
jgi:hypothetical protein